MCRTVLSALIGALVSAGALAYPQERVFRNPTFEELANATVTTVTRAPLSQFAVPAAAFVMPAQEVRATGSRSIQDALRFAPGVQVAQFDSHTWAVGSRGFNSLFVDKLLVLIDGRPVYTPLWSGVYWEQHGWLDQDLDRIEVIRGPGGSTWGANAVNGVINVLSKSARDTRGLAIETGAGDEEHAFGSVRYGGQLSEDSFYRVYAGYEERDDIALANGRGADDAWHMARGGLRYEWNHDDTHLMLKGEMHSGEFDEAKLVAVPEPPYLQRGTSGKNSGGYLQATWSRELTSASELRVDAWWEKYDRWLAPSNEESEAVKLEMHYRLVTGAHTLSAEVGYRKVEHESQPRFEFALSPAELSFDVWSASVQDEVTLAPNLALTAGARVERHDFVGWEWQPNVRLSWQPTERQTVWSAVGRAIRTPSIANEAGMITLSITPAGVLGPGSPPLLQQVIRNREIESEELTAWEIGWRRRFEQGAIDISAFYNDYDQLITYLPLPVDVTTLAPDFWRVPLLPVNAGSGESHGAEFTATWLPVPQWQLDFEVTYLDLQVEPRGDPLADQLTGSSPTWQASLRSSYEMGSDWQVGAAVRYVDELESLRVRSYMAADLRVARRFGDGLEVAIVGRDLWSPRHAEFRSGTYQVNSFVERSAFVGLTWRHE